MIAYREFRPKAEELLPSAKRTKGSFDIALAEANAWIESESIDVINVETIGLNDGFFDIRSIRIWFRTTGKKPEPIPEI